jgi:hypothetical protein
MTKSSTFLRTLFGTALLSSVVSLSVALAGTVEITAGPQVGTITVDARDATTLEIVTKLGERFKFDVHQKSDTAGNTVRTGQWTGPLDDVLRRILQTESHVVAGSAKAPTSVTLLGAGSRTAIAPMPPPSAPPPSVAGPMPGASSSGTTPSPSMTALGPVGAASHMPRASEPAAADQTPDPHPPGSVLEATAGGPKILRPSEAELAALWEARLAAARLDPDAPPPGSVLEATTGGPKPPVIVASLPTTAT